MRKTDVNLLRVAVCIVFVFGLTACKGTEEQVSPDFSLVKDAEAFASGNEMSTASMSLSEQIEFSKKELAQRLSIEIDLITLSGARRVKWRSGALGCPESGMYYTQALVPGVLIILKAGGKSYGYHARRNGKPFYCPQNRVEAPASIQAEDMA